MKQQINTALTLCLILCIVAATLKLFHLNGADYLLMVALPALAVVSVLQGIIDKSLRSVTKGLAIAFACIAVLFKLMHWPDGEVLLKVAIATGLTWAGYFYFIVKDETA